MAFDWTKYNLSLDISNSDATSSNVQDRSQLYVDFMNYFERQDLYGHVALDLDETSKSSCQQMYKDLVLDLGLLPQMVQYFIKLKGGHFVKNADVVLRGHLAALIAVLHFEKMVQRLRTNLANGLRTNLNNNLVPVSATDMFFGKLAEFSNAHQEHLLSKVSFVQKAVIVIPVVDSVPNISPAPKLDPVSKQQLLEMKSFEIRISREDEEIAIEHLRKLTTEPSSASESGIDSTLDSDSSMDLDTTNDPLTPFGLPRQIRTNFKCSECPYRTHYYPVFVRHSNKHGVDQPSIKINTPMATKRSARVQSLITSIKRKPLVENRIKPKVVKTFPCPVKDCSLVLKTSMKLKNHLRSHERLKCFSPDCSQQFDNVNERWRHMAVEHRNELKKLSKHPCTLCGRKFLTSTIRNNHQEKCVR